jgi:hypothetical protein
MTSHDEPNWMRDVLGLDLDPERRAAVVAAYRDILRELDKLRALDLTDVHPAVVFTPVVLTVGGQEPSVIAPARPHPSA